MWRWRKAVWKISSPFEPGFRFERAVFMVCCTKYKTESHARLNKSSWHSMQTKAGGFGCGALNRQPTVGTIRLQAVIVRMQLPQRTQLKVLSKQAVWKSIFRRLACSCVRLRRCRRLIVPARAETFQTALVHLDGQIIQGSIYLNHQEFIICERIRKFLF